MADLSNATVVERVEQLAAIKDNATIALTGDWSGRRVSLGLRKGLTVTMAPGTNLRGASFAFTACAGLCVDGMRFEGGDVGKYGSDVAVLMLEKCPDSRIVNCAIDNVNPPTPTRSKEYKYIYLKMSPNTSVERCTLRNKHNGGAALAVNSEANKPDRITVKYCLFENIHPLDEEQDGNGYEAIRLSDSKRSMESSFSTITSNVFVNCGSEGEPEAVSVKRCDNAISSNSLYNCQGMLTSRHGRRNHFLGNYIFGGVGGIRLIDAGHEIMGNLIQNTHGDGKFRGPIVLVRGLPESPINGYFPADNCVIVGNGLINNQPRNDVYVTDGGKEELTIEPVNAKIEPGMTAYEIGAITPLRKTDVGAPRAVVVEPPAPPTPPPAIDLVMLRALLNEALSLIEE